MSFRDRARKGLAGLVLLGASAGLGGCMTGATQRYNSGLTNYNQYVQEKNAENRYNDAIGFSLLGGLIGARGVQINSPGAVVLGDALSRHGAAMANSPQVIVNSYPPNQPPIFTLTPQIPAVNPLNITLVEQSAGESLVIRVEKERLGLVTAVVSNYCKDFNGDGKFNYPEDYGGMKRVFLPNEMVTLSLASSNSADNLRIELLGAGGRKIDSVEGKGFYLFKEYNLRENIFAAGTTDPRTVPFAVGTGFGSGAAAGGSGAAAGLGAGAGGGGGTGGGAAAGLGAGAGGGAVGGGAGSTPAASSAGGSFAGGVAGGTGAGGVAGGTGAGGVAGGELIGAGEMPYDGKVYGGTFYINGEFLGKLEFIVSDRKWEFVPK